MDFTSEMELNMNNIIDYIKEYGEKTCHDREFCEVDALILSQLAYFRFDKLIPPLFEQSSMDMPSVKLSDIYKAVDPEYV